MNTFLTSKPSLLLARSLALAALVVLTVPTGAGPADARAGGGFSFGSRGARTYAAPSFTPTAPRYAQPIQRSDTPNAGLAGAAQPRGFGLGRGLLAGLFGAGLFGMMTGGGFFGGIASLIGLVFKLALVGAVIWFVLRLVRGGARPVLAGGPSTAARNGPTVPPSGGGAARGTSIAISPADYQAFERTLIEVQSAVSREDSAALGRVTTPEMSRHLGADIEANRRRDQRNDVSGTRLVQGDLSEAWQEGRTAYATVAMRFSAIDVMVDRASGRIVSGDPVHPVEATEVWTFRRDGGGPWLLSAIQQAG